MDLFEKKRKMQDKEGSPIDLFLPFVTNIASTLKGLDVVVMPSLWEACPLLAMETLVAGIPSYWD